MYDTPLREMPRDHCRLYRLILFFRFPRPGVVAIVTFILCLVQITSLRAQEERVRTAAQQLEIQSFRNPEAFFHIGPFEEVLTGSLGTSYTDNASLTPTGKVSDLSFDQALSLNTTWVISHLNQLQFNFGGDIIENFYSDGQKRINFVVTPDSMIQLQFAVSNFRVRLYDTIAYAQNPTTDPSVTNTTDLNDFTNTLGAVVDADLNLAVVSFSADYTYNDQTSTNISGQSEAGESGTRNSYRAGSSVAFHWTPVLLYGIETTATQSSGSGSANVDSINIGPFIRGKLAPLTDINFAGGLSLYDTVAPISSTTYYFAATIRHQLNRDLQLIFTASHDLEFNTSTNLTEVTAFKLATQINLTRFTTLTAAPFLNIGNEKTGDDLGRFTQFGVEAGLGWKPHKRWSTALIYDFIRREADLSTNTYIQNSIALRVNYAF
jgi:hypothetical protein